MTQTPALWFHRAIVSGLQRLLCVSLEGQPASEIITGTALAWVDALWPNREWIETRDVSRINAAFTSMIRTCRRWPVPAQFQEHLPRVELPRLLRKQSDPSIAADNVRRIRTLLGEREDESRGDAA